MSDTFAWTCPFCSKVATISQYDRSSSVFFIDHENKFGLHGLQVSTIVCPSNECKRFTIAASLYTGANKLGNRVIIGNPVKTWQLLPDSSARVFPDYIPAVIRDDYREACLICDLSPKASATLARRCLQGIIRDYWGISKSRLADEINELNGKIDSTTWNAIDAVRKLGNIGAHMEKDINVIVEVDPDEASSLISLIEVLLQEWYIRRHDRDEQMAKVIAAAKSKTPASGSGNP